ncbi:MAG: LON peptidase substrate-binding domain-containing protein [Caldilineaceae bacterium]
MMEMPLFPLKNVVLFPGMVLPLHIFEYRYREMINRCVDEHIPFGVVLIDQGQEVGATAQPFMIGTAARIMRVDRLDDGCMNITTVGTQRFRIHELKHDHSYLAGTVSQFPVVNGATKLAGELAQRVRPQVLDYVELLSKASNTNLRLDRLPEDPLTLAFMIAIALQIKAEDKQKVLEQPGIPEILALESRLISRETKLLEFMMGTQQEVLSMNSGPTGYVFPN